ncbi:MAG: insulinase family protein [Firmicutes bacterium]|nr:insulinase family protein [Bacillota bacterium]
MIKTKIYENGLRFVHQYIKDSKTVGMSISVQCGAVDEPPQLSGISHFMEHMSSGKSTNTRSALQLSIEVDEHGIHANAYTSSENTAYFAECLNEEFDKMAEILADQFFNSAYLEQEITLERNVIMAEIKRDENDHQRRIVSDSLEMFFAGSPLGNSLIGTNKTVGAIARQDLLDYRREHYIAPKIIISVAGGIKYDAALELTEQLFVKQLPQTPQKPVLKPKQLLRTEAPKKELNITEASTQDYYLIAYPGLNRAAKERYALSLFSIIFGGTPSSRLFSEVRIKNGLVYNIFSDNIMYAHDGAFIICFDSVPKDGNKALRIIASEIEKAKTGGITEAELAKAKTIAASSLVFSSVKIMQRALANSNALMYLGKVISLEDQIKNYMTVTKQEVNNVAVRIFDDNKKFFARLGKSLRVGPAAPANEATSLVKPLT